MTATGVGVNRCQEMKMRSMGYWPLLLWALSATGSAAAPPAASVVVNMQVDEASRHPISRFIYGLNFAEAKTLWGMDAPAGVTLSRMGGNRLSAYNWETNASNCGNDCNGTFPNDAYLASNTDPPAQAVLSRMQWAAVHHAAFLATVPMLGFVAADTAGAVLLSTPLAQRRVDRFRVSKARKNAPFSLWPDLKDPFVYQDEYVNRLERAFDPARSDGDASLWYSLDNEPDLWGSTHEEARGNRLAKDRYVLTGYDELVRTSVEHARAVKDVAPKTLLFGPAVSNWNGMANLFHNGTPDEAGRQFYIAYYLDRMREAEGTYGKRLLDVLDVHWYAEALSTRSQAVSNEWAEQDNAMLYARVQSPRSLWDAQYREQSWVSRAAGGPVRLIPRLRELIADHYPGTRIAITEYFFHRGGDISGAIAQADALGIFGAEDVFAAALWPQGSAWAYKGDLAQTYACALAAFRSYRDYDGQNGAFGDISLAATTQDIERTSIYASMDSAHPLRRVLVLLNKSEAAVTALIAFNGPPVTGPVGVWRLSGTVGHCKGPNRVEDAAVAAGKVSIVLPAFSVSTLVLGQ